MKLHNFLFVFKEDNNNKKRMHYFYLQIQINQASTCQAMAQDNCC